MALPAVHPERWTEATIDRKQPVEDPEAEDPEPMAGALILLADNDPERRETTAQVLREAGFEVLNAGNAPEATALFDAHPAICLVITRVILERESGVDLANHVKDSGREVETLMISHFGRDLLRYVPGFTAHDHFLPNPFTPGAFVARVKRLIQRPD